MSGWVMSLRAEAGVVDFQDLFGCQLHCPPGWVVKTDSSIRLVSADSPRFTTVFAAFGFGVEEKIASAVDERCLFSICILDSGERCKSVLTRCRRAHGHDLVLVVLGFG